LSLYDFDAKATVTTARALAARVAVQSDSLARGAVSQPIRTEV